MVLTALDDEQARLELGGTHSVGLGELSRYWLGDFVMLWRPGKLTREAAVRRHARRPRCAGCARVCSMLQRRRRADAPVSDVFDADLTGQVRDFQRQHQLTVDGIAGVQTQIALASAVAGPDTPLLSAIDAHHGG